MNLNMISIGVSDETTGSIKTATKSHDKPSCAGLRYQEGVMIGGTVPAEPASYNMTV